MVGSSISRVNNSHIEGRPISDNEQTGNFGRSLLGTNENRAERTDLLTSQPRLASSHVTSLHDEDLLDHVSVGRDFSRIRETI